MSKNNSSLSQIARGTGALEAEIEFLEIENTSADGTYTNDLAAKRIEAKKLALVQAEALLDALLAAENI